MYQKEILQLSEDELISIQNSRLKNVIKRCYTHLDFYRDYFNEAGINPDNVNSIADIQNLPFTTKQDLRDAYPFGMFCVDKNEVSRIHASSGTTGQATVVGLTKPDLKVFGDCFARSLGVAGARDDSICQVSFGYGLFTGGLGAHEGVYQLGATVVPISTGNTKRQVTLMKDFGVDIICCTPSYAMLIADYAIAHGQDPRSWNLKAGIFGAEPWSDEFREQIQNKLGIEAFDIYGLSEVMGPGVAFECNQHNGLHVNEDHFIVEIIDSETGKTLPDGQWGELVFTTLSKECSPLIRYRTRDISRIIPGKCSCGCNMKRIDRIRGRNDDMLIIRGVNVFPKQIESVVARYKELSPYYLIEVSKEGVLDTMTVKVEIAPDFPVDEIRHIQTVIRKLRHDLRNELGISVEVRIVEPQSLKRSEGKSCHVIDKRNG